MKQKGMLICLAAATALMTYGCATIGPCTNAVVNSARRQAVAAGTMTTQEAQHAIGLESVPFWQAAVATVGDTTLYGAAAWGVYTLAEEAFGDDSTDGSGNPITINAQDSAVVSVAAGSARSRATSEASRSESSSRSMQSAVTE